MPDHAHGVAIVGTYDDEKSGEMRSRLGVYNLSQFPNYPAPNADGYPDKVDVSRRLAFVFGAYPDSCDSGKPYLEGENVPAVEGATKGTYVANEKNCAAPGAVRRAGNLPFNMNSRRALGRRRDPDRDGSRRRAVPRADREHARVPRDRDRARTGNGPGALARSPDRAHRAIRGRSRLSLRFKLGYAPASSAMPAAKSTCGRQSSSVAQPR